jgi:N-methylhydantoinase A
VVNANMVRGISVSSTERGYDVREFALLPFGGAGPLHAVELAEDLGMSRVVIPMYPSTLSAVGLLVANTRHDYVATIAKSEEELVAEEVLAAFKELEARGRAQLKAQNVPDELIVIQWSADIRYQGQSYELNTPVTPKETLAQADLAEVIARFHELHHRIYAYGSAEETVEFINLRVGAIGKVPEVSFARLEKASGDASVARKGSRPVYYPAHGFVETAVYERDQLRPGHIVEGPCLVEEIASTTVITPGAVGTVDEYGNIIVELLGLSLSKPG